MTNTITPEYAAALYPREFNAIKALRQQCSTITTSEGRDKSGLTPSRKGQITKELRTQIVALKAAKEALEARLENKKGVIDELGRQTSAIYGHPEVRSTVIQNQEGQKSLEDTCNTLKHHIKVIETLIEKGEEPLKGLNPTDEVNRSSICNRFTTGILTAAVIGAGIFAHAYGVPVAARIFANASGVPS